MVIAGDLSCHKVPDLSNLSQKIIKAVQKILPKAQVENSGNANSILTNLPNVDKNEAQTSQIQQNIPLQASSSAINQMIFTLNKSACSSSNSGNILNHQVSSNILKLVPLGKSIHSANKNLTVLPLHDNLVEFHSSSCKEIIAPKNIENSHSNSTHLYTINNMKLACLSSKNNQSMADKTPTIARARNSTLPHSSSEAKPQFNTIQTLLTAAQMVDRMSNFKSKTLPQNRVGMPVTILCGAKNPMSSTSRLSNNPIDVFGPLGRATHLKALDNSNKFNCASKKALPNLFEPLDFSIPKHGKSNSTSKSCDTLLNACKGEKNEDEDDEDALIIVDDDDKCNTSGLIDDRDCKVELEEIVLKSEPSSQEENSHFLSQLIGQPCDVPLRDIDQSEPIIHRRKRKRSHLLPND